MKTTGKKSLGDLVASTTGSYVIGLFLLSSLGLALYIMNRRGKTKAIYADIMQQLEKPQDPLVSGNGSYGDYRDLNVSAVFTRNYWTAFDPKYVSNMSVGTDTSPGPARKYAKVIYDAKKGFLGNDNEESVLAVFRNLNNVYEISKIADAFYLMYGTDLLTYLESFMTNGCNADQAACYGGARENYMYKLYEILKTLKK